MTEDNEWKTEPENNAEETEYAQEAPQTEDDYNDQAEVVAAPPEGDPVTPQVTMEILQLQGQAKSGANWFYWIAVLSLINSVSLLSGSEWGFVIGLGITTIIDAIALAFTDELGTNAALVIAFVFDVIVAGMFIVIGVFAGKRQTWAFILGMILYGLDGLLFLIGPDLLGLGFHIFALWCIWNGFKSHRALMEHEKDVRYALKL